VSDEFLVEISQQPNMAASSTPLQCDVVSPKGGMWHVGGFEFLH